MMSPSIESKRSTPFPERKTCHPGIRKRPRYLISWEESFRRLPNHLITNEREPISSSTRTTNKPNNRFGLADLFGQNRWASSTSTKPSRTCGGGGGIHSSDNKPSKFFTLRIEHRRGGALAKHVGEERILLFRSDQAGAIAKIIFSSTLVGYDESHGDTTTTTQKRRRQFAKAAANAKIHVLFVKDAYRGFHLGGLLFMLCTKILQERYYNEIYPTLSIHCVLDAEEDVRRHGKLVHFYEHLGLRKRKRAKATFINNNDGETYCRIPMNIDLLASSSSSSSHDDSDITGNYSSFLPALFVSAMGKTAKVDNQNIGSWVIVECQDGTMELRTNDGRSLQQDGQGRCKLVPMQNHSTKLGNFQLLRVSDKLDKVLWNKDDDEYSTTTIQQQQQKDQNIIGKEKELWMLRSRLQGTFLGLTSDNENNNNLILSSEASFWQVDENFCLVHTTDSPARRQHYRRMWKTQSVAYVSKMRKKYLPLKLCTMTIKKALDLTQRLLANPFSMSIGDRACNSSRSPSVRTLLFHTAELARKEGHPDWVQFVALIHGLAGALRCLESDNSDFNSGDQDTETFDFDWTIPVDARIMGCKASHKSIFQEFRHLNPDKDDPRYNTTNGVYKKNVGLENVLLSWTSNEYMYHMLKRNNVMLPMEAYAILRLFPLVDWHKWDSHGWLANEDDQEVKPFVADVYELFQRSRDAMMSNKSRTSKEMSENECTELWTNHYSLIANKYGAGGILDW